MMNDDWRAFVFRVDYAQGRTDIQTDTFPDEETAREWTRGKDGNIVVVPENESRKVWELLGVTVYPREAAI